MRGGREVGSSSFGVRGSGCSTCLAKSLRQSPVQCGSEGLFLPVPERTGASGFDAGAFDPLGRQMMTGSGFRSLTTKLMAVADEVCAGRIVMCHEGGYNGATVPFFGLAVVETLSGVSTGTVDPFDELFGGLGGQSLQPHQEAVIKQAEGLINRLS